MFQQKDRTSCSPWCTSAKQNLTKAFRDRSRLDRYAAPHAPKSRTQFAQTVRRPVMRLMISTMTATTSKRWIKLPATWNPQPSSHRINRIAKIVQSIRCYPGQRAGYVLQSRGSAAELAHTGFREVHTLEQDSDGRTYVLRRDTHAQPAARKLLDGLQTTAYVAGQLTHRTKFVCRIAWHLRGAQRQLRRKKYPGYGAA